MNVVATAPIPGSRMPSLPSAAVTPTPFLSAIRGTCTTARVLSIARLRHSPCLPGGVREQRSHRCRIVRHDAVGAELEQARRFARIVDGPEVDAQPNAVALRDERRAIEVQRTLMRRHLRGGAGERQLAPQ